MPTAVQGSARVSDSAVSFSLSRFSLDDDMYALLRNHWSPLVIDGLHTGWEETTELSLGYLLKTVLGKGGRDAGATMAPGPLAKVEDTDRLKRHMVSVCERLAKRS
jgi:hypothetical protein